MCVGHVKQCKYLADDSNSRDSQDVGTVGSKRCRRTVGRFYLNRSAYRHASRDDSTYSVGRHRVRSDDLALAECSIGRECGFDLGDIERLGDPQLLQLGKKRQHELPSRLVDLPTAPPAGHWRQWI